MDDKWKVCALCRFLETVDRGIYIEDIEETEYSLFHCKKLDVYQHEEYLMVPTPASTEEMEPKNDRVCPYWEPWEDDTESPFIGLPEDFQPLSINDVELILDRIEDNGDN